jgi:hypothetical protein
MAHWHRIAPYACAALIPFRSVVVVEALRPQRCAWGLSVLSGVLAGSPGAVSQTAARCAGAAVPIAAWALFGWDMTPAGCAGARIAWRIA